MLICNNQLDASQLHALDNLTALCRAVDGDLPPLYTHILEQKRVTENNFLYFQDNRLVGFLSLYFFYANAAEVSVIVDPSHRRQGIAKKLIQAALPLLESKQVDSLLFSNPATVNEAWLSRLGFLYKNSEYHMERNSYEPLLITKHALTIRKAAENDIFSLCAIDQQCFTVEPENMPMRFINLLNDNSYTIVIALRNGKAVGKAHIRWQDNETSFSDIAIIPQFQNQGLGSELLAYCINHALMLGKTKLALDVETSNHNALNLYTRHGFKSVNAIDFWTISTKKLAALYNKDTKTTK